MKDKIVAVVVTYNRLNLLKRCIDALRNQTYQLDFVIVVNNGSTDGTEIWLDQQVDLQVIHQENLGGAGGFARGMKEAYDAGFDWIWVMDDDGYPSQNCLSLLAEYKSEFKVIAPLVVNVENVNETAFLAPNNLIDVEKIQENSKTIKNWASFFNGILFNRDIMLKIGFPNPKLFIWGDERDYFHKILEQKIEIITITNSVFFHPKDRLYEKKFMKLFVFTGENNWKSYCFYRNNAFIVKRYYNSLGIRWIVTQIIYNTITKKPLKGFYANLTLLRGTIDGINGNFSKKLPY
jgi:rhamnopyranosyl-N-acetylglucosaminyl-diphospho-decaprenol beta-1,3/1,4-galactofuranosyltransferase